MISRVRRHIVNRCRLVHLTLTLKWLFRLTGSFLMQYMAVGYYLFHYLLLLLLYYQQFIIGASLSEAPTLAKVCHGFVRRVYGL